MTASLDRLDRRITACQLCPRLRAWCAEVARVKRRAYREEEYWGRPVPGFGDPEARLYIVGLAPGAHGANRTGRIFTGDSSGDWLYRALHAAGFANQPESRHRGDGLALRDCRIGVAVRCAPPDNKPAPPEFENCRRWLEEELRLLPRVRVVVALGRLAFDSYLTLLRRKGLVEPGFRPSFAHSAEHRPGPGLPVLLCSYHPSRQNTQTGRLTAPMLAAAFIRARQLLEDQA